MPNPIKVQLGALGMYHGVDISIEPAFSREGGQDRFILGEHTHLMPFAILYGSMPLIEAHKQLSGLEPGAVAMRYGLFWFFWKNGDCIAYEESNEAREERLREARIRGHEPEEPVVGLELEMHHGCYQLLDTGVWSFLGAS